jgi:hypothetical protein
MDRKIISVDFKPQFEGHELAIAFFIQFARFEYAMKKAGFHTPNGDANWDGLFKMGSPIDKLTSAYKHHPDEEFKEAVDYYLTQSPEKQFLENNKIIFKKNDLGNAPIFEKLSVFIRRVRNNLFHGGKFARAGCLQNPPRDMALISHGLVILNACIQAEQNLWEFYMFE